MNHAAVLVTCRGLPGATEGYPFGEGALVFKVGGKMFAILSAEGVSLKCDPVFAVAFREQYPAVTAGGHLDKRHSNTVLFGDSLPSDVLYEWITESDHPLCARLTRAPTATFTLLKNR